MKLGEEISWLMGRLQQNLFPRLEECWETPLTEKEQQLVAILELVRIENYIPKSAFMQLMGRKTVERAAIARAFVAKMVYTHPFTRTTIEVLHSSPNLRRICGFVKESDIPSESTFSRAFAEYAESGLGEKVHNALVEQYLKPELVGHVSRDSTAIEGREKPVKKEVKVKPAPRKRGRPAEGEIREPKKEKRLDRQRGQTAEEALQELPAHCDVGTKKNSKGHKDSTLAILSTAKLRPRPTGFGQE